MTNSTINNNNIKPCYQDSCGAVVKTFAFKIGTPGITIDTAIRNNNIYLKQGIVNI